MSAILRPKTLVLPPVPYAIALYGSWWMEENGMAWPLSVVGAFQNPIGWLAVAAGLALLLWTVLTLWRFRTTVNPYRAATHLCVSGPFRFSRNPIYVGDGIIYLGVMLILHSAWPIVFAPMVWLIIRYGVIRHEETHLRARFGAEYVDYLNKVRRWL